MKGARFKRDAEAITARYQAEIEALAVEARALLLPYFARKGWEYKAGNGSWYIGPHDAKHTEMIDDDDLPAWVRELLYIEFDHGNLLGFYIADMPGS